MKRPRRSAPLAAAIRERAAELGFSLCGFAPAQQPPHGSGVADWVAEGCAGEMAYIERGLAKRLDVSLVLQDARGIVTLAYPYAPPPPAADWRAELMGRIAAYAAGPDYHGVVLAKIESLAREIRTLVPSCRTVAYVDTGPILEREWAESGGLGWFGKNTMILHPRHGSWFFLGEILTDIAFEAEPPVPNRCGSCRRCIDLCPTGALGPAYRLDARLCISYLTIEHRGPIPSELRPGMGNWLFGCDVCQDVCPWNGKAGAGHGAGDELAPYLPDVLRMSEEQFRARFRGTAIWRARRAGLLRNAAIALGNSGNPDALPPLIEALAEDPSALVRGHAAWAIGALPRAPRAQAAIERAARGDPDDFVRTEAKRALGLSIPNEIL